MTQGTVQLTIPFETLLDSLTTLDVSEKRRLWQVLDDQLAQLEEELWEQEPQNQASLREAREAYEAGDYVSIDEYVSSRAEQKL